jgi:periplasmic protein TonB
MKLFSFIVFLFLFSSFFAEANVYGSNNANHLDTIKVDDEPVFLAVENQPEFPGGEEALVEFIARNVKYPPIARENGIQGKVFVSFIIEIDGSVSTIKIVRGIGGSCDEEAKRVVGLLPNFIPGRQNDKLVRVQYIVPVNFKLSGKK